LALYYCCDTAVAVAILALVLHWALERARLHEFVASLGPLPTDATELALALAGRIANRSHRSGDPPYIAAFLAPLGATAGDIIRHGGCCSGTSRLYMLALGALGIRANQITVYHRSGRAQHCLVEIHLPQGVLIADPVYGVFYTDANGRTLGLEDLQAGAPVECRPAPGAMKPGYPANSYYDFNFAMTKTANWTKSWQRRLAYSLLQRITNGGIDRFRVPQLFEWPQAMLALVLASILSVTHAFLFLLRWFSAT